MTRNTIGILLALLFTIALVSSCDDDEPQIENNTMVLVEKASGMIYAVNLNNGSLTELDSITYNGTALEGIRDMVYNPADQKIYVTLNGKEDGKVFAVNSTTLQATLINDNANEDWDAIAEIVISNGKLLGTTYLNEPQLNHCFILIELNGTRSNEFDFMDGGVPMDTDCGMGLEFGRNNNELIFGDEDNVFRSDLTGNIMEGIDLNYVGFPNIVFDFCITSLEKDDNGDLFGLTSDGHLVAIDLDAKEMTLIHQLTGTENKYHGLSKLPADLF